MGRTVKHPRRSRPEKSLYAASTSAVREWERVKSAADDHWQEMEDNKEDNGREVGSEDVEDGRRRGGWRRGDLR